MGSDLNNMTKDPTLFSLECLVSQTRTRGRGRIFWLQQIGEGEPQRVPQQSFTTQDVSPDTNYIIMKSALTFARSDILNITQIERYWCAISTTNMPSTVVNNSYTFSKVATVRQFESYQLLPPCPADSVFHIAETMCINSSLSRTPERSTSDSSSKPESTTLIKVAIGIGTAGLVTGVIAIAAMAYFLLKKQRRRQRNQQTKKFSKEIWLVI